MQSSEENSVSVEKTCVITVGDRLNNRKVFQLKGMRARVYSLYITLNLPPNHKHTRDIALDRKCTHEMLLGRQQDLLGGNGQSDTLSPSSGVRINSFLHQTFFLSQSAKLQRSGLANGTQR